MIRLEDVFTRISNNRLRAWCPECDLGSNRPQGTVTINEDYAFCHKCQKTWHFDEDEKIHKREEYVLSNTKAVVSVDKGGYADARNAFINGWEKFVKAMDLPWNEQCLKMPVGVRKNDDGKPQLVFQINDNHVKHHKGKQFGDAQCKMFGTPQLSKDYLILCEGEKDVVTAYCQGAPAITFTSGAGALPAEVTLPSQYNKLYIIYDNDEKGIEGSKKVAKRLFSKELELYAVDWKDKPSGYDITDWFSDGNTLENLLSLCVRYGESAVDLGGMQSFSMSQFRTTFNQLPRPIIDSLFYDGDIMGIAGGTNVGKSVFSLQLSMCLAMGVPFMNYRIPTAQRVLHVQFELKDESFSGLIKNVSKPLMDQYPIESENLDKNLRFTGDGQSNLFQDKWDIIDANLVHEEYDVLVVDNLYTSTQLSMSKNSDIMELLRKIVNIKKRHKVAIVLVSHHKKIGEMTPLDVSQLLGGSAYSNFLDCLVQMADARRVPGLKVMKITKVRSHNELHNVPVGIKMINIDEEDRRELYFKYMKPLPKNEMYWYSDPKESNEERVLAAVMTDGHNFSTTAFASALESVMKLSSNNAVYGWLKRLEDQGLIRKIDHGNYRKIVTELDDFID